MGTLHHRLAGLCHAVHTKLDIPLAGPLYWSDSLHWRIIRDTLIFSGSDSIWDWKHNLQLWPTRSPTGPGWVHAGFLGLARLTWPQIKETVLGGRYIKFVSGYSMGAGVALLVAEKLKEVEVVTFACPVVGDSTWGARHPHPVTRCWVKPDWLTSSMLGRSHFGIEYVIPGGWNPVLNHQHTLERNWR